MEDEFQAINIMYMYDGCSRAWHYDGTDTVITLLLQKADVGGEYEFAPFIRGEEKGDERFEDVARLFEGTYDGNIVKNADAGTLNLFNGIRSDQGLSLDSKSADQVTTNQKCLFLSTRYF